MNEILTQVKRNPHFEHIETILLRDGIDPASLMPDFTDKLHRLVMEHANDNETLKEESFYYILPAIAMYQALKRCHHDPLAAFREMWLHGAEKGAAFLKEKAKDKSFLHTWIQNVTPKDCDAGAFVFEIIQATEKETEYHVKKCPYVDFCREYGCPEIITVFCDSDDISFGNIHPRLIWGRTKTIGRGDPVCDFRYVLLEDSKQ